MSPDFRLRLTHHARSTMDSRQVTFAEVLDVFEHYRHRYSSFSHQGQPTPDTYVYQGDQLTLVVVESGDIPLVKTVLLNDRHTWTDEDARNRPRTGQEHPA